MVTAREALQKISDRKLLEIQSLQTQLAEARAYHQAMQDAIKALPRDPQETGEDFSLREGTAIAQARDILFSAGRPLHILEILRRMGRPTDKPSRVSLSGSLSAYVRKNQVFRKTAPNTFSLIGQTGGSGGPQDTSVEEFPLGFGNLIDASETPSAISSSESNAQGGQAVAITRNAVVAALDSLGHSSAAQLLRSAEWSLDESEIRIQVAGLGKKMVSLTVNAAAEKIIRDTLAKIGAPTRFLVTPSSTSTLQTQKDFNAEAGR